MIERLITIGRIVGTGCVANERDNTCSGVIAAGGIGPKSAPAPLAVLFAPEMLLPSAALPVAVFKKPTVLLTRASKPVAVLFAPVVLSSSAFSPVAVFWLPVVLL